MPWAVVGSIGAALVGGIASNRAANKVADAQQRAIDANAWQGEIALDQYEDYKATYRPLEHQLVKEAQRADSDEAYEQAAGQAHATVQSQLGLARDRLSRTPGLDPSSAAAHAAHTNLALQGAAMGAVEQNKARQRVKDTAFARKMDAAGLGRGLVAGASTGMAHAAAGADAIARTTAQQANQQAAGVGAVVGGIANGLSKVDWGNFGIGSGAGSGVAGGVAVNNTGNPVWTQFPTGASGYPDGVGGGV